MELRRSMLEPEEEDFRPASEVFGKGAMDLDYLNQHGSGSSSVSHLARQSLYQKFDPLVGGRPSIMGRPSMAPYKAAMEGAEEVEEETNSGDLIAMNSPSPMKPSRGVKPNASRTKKTKPRKMTLPGLGNLSSKKDCFRGTGGKGNCRRSLPQGKGRLKS